MTPLPGPFWKGKRLLVTGHTGFKGGWLAMWLHSLGAEVHGLALDPPSDPNLFQAAHVERALASHTIADIRDIQRLSAVVKDVAPDVVFHLAAQALVRPSYQHPVETYDVNVMGVVHLLEATRASGATKALVNVTTDKCYENHERLTGYREDEPLGGRDPYSSSKACAELVTAAYSRSFLADAGVAVATARAGNVIGGGDWAADRLLPDLFRAIDSNRVLKVRSPGSIRPWQHVLAPLSGYLLLAERLFEDGAGFAEAWNFGPADEDGRSVGWIVERLRSRYPAMRSEFDTLPKPHEAQYLKLDSSKARSRLQWRPGWNLETGLDKTMAWHEAWRGGRDMHEVTLAQIAEYEVAHRQASSVAD